MAVVTESLVLDFGILGCGVFCALYVYFVRNFNFWMKRGIPFLKPVTFVGNFRELVLGRNSIGGVLQEIYNQAKGKPYVGILAFDQPMLVVRDIELIHQILVKDFDYFVNRNFNPDINADPLTARNLFSLQGNKWKELRAGLTPTFTSSKLKMMFNIMNQCGQDLTKYLDHKTAVVHDVKEAMSRYTTDVIVASVFGIESCTLKENNSDFRKVLKRISEFSFIKNFKVFAAFFAPTITKILKPRIIDEDIVEYMRKIIWNSVEKREKNGMVRNDFLDLLVQIKNKGFVEDTEDKTSNKSLYMAEEKYGTDMLKLEGDDFVAQAFAFLTTGFETSSTTMSFTLYELALHHDVQQKAHNEIKAVLAKNNGKLTYEGLQEMKYLNMVVLEALRKYPVMPFLDRATLSEYILPGTDITLEKGLGVLIPVLGLHMDPDFYPDPECFDPERFSEEKRKSRPHYAYLPFGEGPRSCIGSQVGLMQMKVGLAYILPHFEVSLRLDTPVPLTINPRSVLLASLGDIPLTFTKI